MVLTASKDGVLAVGLAVCAFNLQMFVANNLHIGLVVLVDDWNVNFTVQVACCEVLADVASTGRTTLFIFSSLD